MNQVEIIQRLQLAVALHNQGELDQAEAIYRQILTVDEDNFYALRFLGCLCRLKGSFTEGIFFLRKAVDQRPCDKDALYNLANLYMDSCNHSEAVEFFERCLAIDDRFAEALMGMGWSLLEIGRVNDSCIVLKKAVGINPGLFQAWMNLGNTLKEMGDIDGCISSYRKAIDLKPDFADAKKAYMECLGENRIREQLSCEDYRVQVEGDDEAGILIAAYQSFDAIPPGRRSINSWINEKNEVYFAGQMFSPVFLNLPWVNAIRFAEGSNVLIPEAGNEYLDAVDIYFSRIKTLQIRLSQAPLISSLLESVARKKGGLIDVVDVGGWSGNALFLAGFNDSWDVVRSWEVLETKEVCVPAREQLPALLEGLPEGSGGKSNLGKLSFIELESFYGSSSTSHNIDLIWSSGAQHYNACFPRDLETMLSRGAELVYFDTLPYLSSCNPTLNVCEFTETGVSDQMVSFLMSQKYLTELVVNAANKYRYSLKIWSQYIEPKLVFWQPQDGDQQLPTEVTEDAKPLLMKVCSIRFDKLD